MAARPSGVRPRGGRAPHERSAASLGAGRPARSRASPTSDIHLHHGALSVSDMARSIRFYESILGFRVDTRVDAYDGELEIVHLKKGRSFIELFCRRGATPLPEHAVDYERDFGVVGTKHIAFMTRDPGAVHKRLQRHGVVGLTPIFDNSPHYLYFFFKDPDGIVLEIVSRRRRSRGRQPTRRRPR